MHRWSNLDAEYAWARAEQGLEYHRTAHALAICERWPDVLALRRDLLPGPTPPAPLAQGPLVPWAWTREAVARARALGAVPGHWPELAVVARVNRKDFSHALEVALGMALPHAAVVGDLGALGKAVARCPGPWVLKHPLGVSGRERVRGTSGELAPAAEAWARRQFQGGWPLVFEPWVSVVQEISVQFEVAPHGEVHLLGMLALVTDATGAFRGHRSLPSGSHEAAPGVEAGLQARLLAIGEGARRAVEQVAAQGYFGPVGVDAMWGFLPLTEGAARAQTPPGEPVEVVRPVTEINARHTFGRMALELVHWLPVGAAYTWWHPSQRRAPAAQALAGGPWPGDDRGAEAPWGIYRLPEAVDPGGQSQTVLAVAPDVGGREALEQRLGLWEERPSG